MAEGFNEELELLENEERYEAEYENHDMEALEAEYDRLDAIRKNDPSNVDASRRMVYIDRLLDSEGGDIESSFIDEAPDHEETSWIDGDLDYKHTDTHVIKMLGAKDRLGNYLTRVVGRDGNFGTNAKDKVVRQDFVKLTRSFLAVSDGGEIRPLLNNEVGHKILKNIKYSRGGSIKSGGFRSILSYKDVDVREFSVSGGVVRRLNDGEPIAQEFNGLIKELFETNNATVIEIANNIDEGSLVAKEDIRQIISNSDYLDGTHIQEMVEREIERGAIGRKPGEVLDRLRKDVEDDAGFGSILTGSNPFDDIDLSGLDNMTIPDSMLQDIADDSSNVIHDRLHERAEILEDLSINNQELREWSGVLRGKTIEALDVEGNTYRLKSLREVDKRKETAYKNIADTAYLKSDYLRVRNGEPPEHEEAKNIMESVVDSNEAINDLSRLERFKKWAKENLVGISAITISIAGIITTVIIGARKAIAQGAKATSKFAKAVANLGKKFGLLLGPLLNIIAQAISWGAKGLAWLASNLWVLAIAAALIIYDRYGKRK